MKIKIAALLFIAITAFSCDELDELTEFDVTENFTVDYNVSVIEDSEGEPQNFYKSESIDISSNEEIQDNLNLIQDVTINTLTYEIVDFSGVENATLTEGMISFGNSTTEISNINLQQSDINNTVYTITDTNLLDAIEDDLENNTEIIVSISGVVNETPITFDLLVNLDVTVTIDVL